MEAKNNLGERVRLARSRFEPVMSQDSLTLQLARRGTSINRNVISNIEHGRREATDLEVEALAKVLQVSTAWLRGEEEILPTSGSPKQKIRSWRLVK